MVPMPEYIIKRECFKISKRMRYGLFFVKRAIQRVYL